MSPTNTKDSSTHYQILGLKKESSSQEIKNAFLNLSKSHHPDLHPNDPTKHETFVRIMEAYTVLSKPGLRRIYDSDTFESALKSRARRANGFSSDDFDVETNAPRYTTYTNKIITCEIIQIISLICSLLHFFLGGKMRQYGKCAIGKTTSSIKISRIMGLKVLRGCPI